MAAPTATDWGHIHAMAWKDREFRTLLETDPKKAIAKYGKEVGKTFDKVVRVKPKPKGAVVDTLHKHPEAKVPPACC